MADAIKGRGALSQPPGRFDKLTHTLEHDGWYEEEPPNKLETVVLPETARTIISRNKSPDIGFQPVDQSVSGMRTWMHLLLRPPQPRLRRSFSRPRFRNQTFLQSRRGSRPRKGTRRAELQMLAHHARREHRSVPANRKNTQSHAFAARGDAQAQTSRVDHHQGRARGPRRRSARGARARRTRCA